ncbi:MAG: DUF1318 domain-containing protein [Rhodocyclales bacterium]|nr:DUF1318 domain-containing protein [Rhodocyclales bacterium]
MRRGAVLTTVVFVALAGLAACESTPERVFTYGAHGAEIQAERFVADVYGRPSDPLPYGGADIDYAVAGIKARWPSLKPLLDDGTLGLTEDGEIAIRDGGRRDAREMRRLRALVRAENRDRFFLYRGVTAGIGHGGNTLPLMLDYTEEVFAREWSRQAPSTWWVQDAHGRWQQRPAADSTTKP